MSVGSPEDHTRSLVLVALFNVLSLWVGDGSPVLHDKVEVCKPV